MVNSIQSHQLVLLDFFDQFTAEINELISSSIVKTLCEPIIDLTIVFSDIKNMKEVLSFVDKLDLPTEEIEELKTFFQASFQTSFSYGYGDKEFVFIRLEQTSLLLNKEHDDALLGLILHEILHSIQRQRGLEVRLNNSLVFSLDFFSKLASLLPPSTFQQEKMINFLKEISQISLFALKDIYVNVEMMKRGFGHQLLEFYRIELRFSEANHLFPPEFDVPFEKGKIKIQDLNEFARAFNFTISLIPVWLPSMVLEVESRDYEPSRELKHFIFNKYYTNPSLITREMWQVENTFLTSFSFSKSFHLKWFGVIFNLALEYLLGEDFVFYYLSKAAELVEELYPGDSNLERRSLAMVPILKAAYVHKQEYPAGIQQNNITKLDSIMKNYGIDKEEISELEESLDDIAQTEGAHVAHFFENLLQLSIMIIVKDFRQHVLLGDQQYIKDFGRVILTLLQAISYLGDQCDDQYYHSVRITVKRIIRSTNILKQKQFALELETITKEEIFTSDLEPTLKEIRELIFNFDFFEIPISNMFIELGVTFIQNIKTVLNKVPIEDPDFPLLASQFIGVLLREKNLEIEDLDQVDMILVSSLIAASGVPFSLVQPVLELFIGATRIISDGDDKEIEEELNKNE